MLNVGKIEEGFVLDHIEAGKSLTIYHLLQLDKLDCDINTLNIDVLGFIDHNITVNVIKDGKIVEKRDLSLPKEIKNVIKCRNPRCITSIEQELPHIFVLADEKKEIYRCKYCEEKCRKRDLFYQ